MRVLVAGDTHGNSGWSERLVRYAKSHDIDTILQVGDFGYWPHMPGGQRFLKGLSKTAKDEGITWWWIDGNHENHDWLDEEGAFDAAEPTETHKNLIYIPRGYRWTWEGVSFLGLGGATSIDRKWRTAGVSWWAKETITTPQAERAVAGGYADVMITHDAPDGVKFPFQLIPEEASLAHRVLMRQIVDEIKPKLLIHGHYHDRFTSKVGNTITEGLSKDGDGAKGFCILDLPSLDITHPRDW